MKNAMWTEKELKALNKVSNDIYKKAWAELDEVRQDNILDIMKASPEWWEVTETTTFVKGAVYKLRCQSGKEAKRTATFLGMYNDVEGLFRIGATTQPVRIKTTDKGECTVKHYWGANHYDLFSKYENILAWEDRIA